MLVALASLPAARRARTLARRLEDGGRAARVPAPAARGAAGGAGAAARGRRAAAAVPRRRGGVRGRRSPRWRCCVSFAPDVWNTEKPMDMAFMTAINASDTFPPQDPWMAGESLNYYYFGHLLMAMPMQVLAARAERRLQPRARRAVRPLAPPRCSRSRARCGRRRACRCAAGRSAPGWPRWRCASCSGTSRAAKAWVDADDPPGDYDWFAPSRVIKDTINEFPRSRSTSATCTRTCWRCRSRCWRWGSRCRSRSPGRAATPPGARWPRRWSQGWRSGRCTRSTPGRIPSPPGCWCSPWSVWARTPEAAGRRGYAVVWTVLVLVASVVAVLPFLLDFDSAARGVGRVTEHRGSWTGRATTRSSTPSSPGR